MADDRNYLNVRGRALAPDGGPFVFGILNVTLDSFSDGGVHADPVAAVEAGLRMADDGADVIDVGGESTRPGSAGVAPDEQIRRVVPIIDQLAARFGTEGPAISIDTRSAAVARAAIEHGARIINDVAAGRDDPAMFDLAAARGAAIVLMHMRGTPATMQNEPVYGDVVAEVKTFLAKRAETAVRAGVSPERIVIDPGIGFGKMLEHNLALLRGMGSLRSLGWPLLVGPSRKRFIGQVLGIDEPRDRLHGTTAVVTACVLAGAECVRVHDVAAGRQAADMATALRGGVDPWPL